MKKKLLCIPLFTLFFCPIISQAQGFEEGQMSVTAGYGYPNFAGILFKPFDIKYTGFSASSTGPLFAKFEYALSDVVGVGLNYAYTSAIVKYDDIYYGIATNDTTHYQAAFKYTSMSFLARINFHFSEGKALDPYLGIGMGYRLSTFKYIDNYSEGSFKLPVPFGMDITFGLRYFFTENFGMYTEIGLAKGLVQGGISYAF